jgi:DNA-binding MarR family transcriptional regulator
VDIAHRLGITTASATGMVDRLVDSGHLERHPHPTDRRRVRLRHTPQAEAVMWQALAPLLAGVTTVEERLTDEERAVVARFLRDIAAVWRAMDTD